MSHKLANMAERATNSIADLLRDELACSCPYEGMSRQLFDIDGEIVGSSFENGNLVFKVKRGRNIYRLELNPVAWTKDEMRQT